jgi:NarL family two-component system response regulator LiaR
MPVRLLLADDHALFRAGLRSLFAAEEELQVLAEHGDGLAALDAILELKPDVAVLDVEMPGMTGIEIARKLNQADSLTSVVVVSMHEEAAFVRAAIEAGVLGYVVKQDAAAELLDAIHAAAKGDLYLSPRIAGTLAQALRDGRRRTQLTPRESDVVRLLAAGKSSREIAAALQLSAKTVDGYRSAIMEKLGIHSVAGLVKYALRHQLATLED